MSTNSVSHSQATSWVYSLKAYIINFLIVLNIGFLIINFLCSPYGQKILKHFNFPPLLPEPEPSWVFVVFMIIALCITVPIFIIHSLPRSKEIRKADELIRSLDGYVVSSGSIANHLEQFKRTKSYFVETNKVENKKALYKEFEKAREDLQAQGGGDIHMTNFLVKLDDPESKEYYEKEVDYCIEYDKVHVYKIITIHHKSKLDVYKNIVEKAHTHHLKNLHIAYLRVPNFEKSTWFPEVIGVQVLANNKVILMDPRVARLTTKERGCKPLAISEELNGASKSNFVVFFEEYHEELWKKIKDTSGDYGCILYDGDDDIQLDQCIWDKIEKQMNQIHVWDEKNR